MFRQLLSCCFATGLLLAMQSVASQELTVRGGYSGNWYDPDRDGQGVQIEILEGNRAVVAWYTFGPGGDPVWLFGVGGIRGDTISVELDSYAGGSFPSTAATGTATAESWGSAEIRFIDCANAEMSWETARAGYDPGSMPLERLTAIEGQRCGGPERFERTLSFSLDAGPGPWEAVFADYPVGDNLDLQSEWTRLPGKLSDRHGLMLAGTNTSDDLAMFFKAPVAGLRPSTRYEVELEMTFATSVPQDCVGVGGSPGSGVYVKLGAAGREPERITVFQGGREYYRLNVNKGGQSRGGRDALVVGNMANDQENCPPLDQREWQLKTVSTEGMDFSATTGEDGTLWIFGGTDSAFEATTVYFVTDFTVRLSRTE